MDRATFVIAYDALAAARMLIEKPERWWNSTGEWPSDPPDRLNLHLAIGEALEKLQVGQRDEDAVTEVYRAICDPVGGYPEVFKFEETHTHDDVLALVDGALERLLRLSEVSR